MVIIFDKKNNINIVVSQKIIPVMFVGMHVYVWAEKIHVSQLSLDLVEVINNSHRDYVYLLLCHSNFVHDSVYFFWLFSW